MTQICLYWYICFLNIVSNQQVIRIAIHDHWNSKSILLIVVERWLTVTDETNEVLLVIIHVINTIYNAKSVVIVLQFSVC